MSKKLMALGVIFGLAACGGGEAGEDELELETDGMQMEEQAPPATTVQPMDTSMMDTTQMDTMGM